MNKLFIIIILFVAIMWLIYDVLYAHPTSDYFSPYIPLNRNAEDNLNYVSTHTGYPFWNSQIGSTRNMSYDLRGDVQIPYLMNLPFNMSSRIPIQNKTLSDIS